MSVSHNEIFSRCTSPFTSKIDLTWSSTLRFGIWLLDYFLLLRMRESGRLKDCNHYTAFETKMGSIATTLPGAFQALIMIRMITPMEIMMVITMILIIMVMAMEPPVTTYLVHSNHGLGIETFATQNFPTCSKHLICTM